MIISSLELRDFRSYERLELAVPPGISVVVGDNGAGKTNLLEAIYAGSVSRSCRTNVETRMIRFGSDTARVELEGAQDGHAHSLAVGISRKQPKSLQVDGVAVASFEDIATRPLVAVFMPDRLELVKGAPGLRRAHFDQVIAALWPARRETRKRYAATLAQRNALIARGVADAPALDNWDIELARSGHQLALDRMQLVETLSASLATAAAAIGLDGDLGLRYRPSIEASDQDDFYAQIVDRRSADAQRGFTMAGPHRDEFVMRLGKLDLRLYGSQGQQRASLLSLLLAECMALAEFQERTPLVLLDDVMSELDGLRRESLLQHVATLAQCVVTTTDLAHVPDLGVIDAAFAVQDGSVLPISG
ncbi:MAG: DNA replication/repair protein RecF [Thermoleophilaceae bacterium]|nr:DNA replication/repair protein RecF [Thermoleophilaceae bacterium]